MAIDYERIAARLQRQGLNRNEAWDAISKTYITAERCQAEAQAESEAQLAEYLYQTALWWHKCWLRDTPFIVIAVRNKDSEVARLNGGDDPHLTEDEVFVDPPKPQSDADYIADLLKTVPLSMRIPTLCVIHKLLDHPPTKPLSVETCRKILQKAGIGNTSEFARHVYTFLTTLRRNHD
jgi:hypothetical protein